ncbi:MAG TPA: PP2C family protein-serine/threonine phosphatase [Pirellulales bacterium]|nr:PP2C family protein-serine/threonine phosphatase [Pirellulales bacterium]
MMTGQGDEAIAVATMRAGAQDYCSKNGFTPDVLDRAVRMAMQKHARKRKRDAARVRIQTAFRKEKSKRRELEASLRAAHDIQQKLIPARAPAFAGFDIAGAYLPAQATSGDFFDYLPIIRDELGIVVGDVSGHGLGAALLAAEIRAYTRALWSLHPDLGDLAKIVNGLLCEDMMEGEFATLMFGKFHRDERSLTYLSAGHPALLVRADGTDVSLETQSIPLGMMDEIQGLASVTVPLDPGDIVLLLTDGLTETTAANGEWLFGNTNCFETIRAHRTESAGKIVERLLLAARAFAQGEPQHDDITVVVVKIADG